MKQQTEIFEAILSDQAIDDFSQRVREFCAGLKLENRDIVRYAITTEEILFKTSLTQPDAKIRITTGIRLLRPFISLEIDGKPNNVFAKKGEEKSVLGDSLLKNLGLSPEYSYNDDSNIYTFRIRKKSVSPFIKLVIALVSSAVIGSLGFFIPDSVRTVILNTVLTPLHDTFLNILGCIAGPMIFLSVAWGIYGIGDAATLKKIGKRMLRSYIGTVFVMCVFFGLILLSVFKLNYTGGIGNNSELTTVIEMLLNIIPKNIFSPFVDGNTLQIIFLAIVIGIAMLFLGQKTNAVAKAVEQINYIVQFLIEFISRLVPYFIFIVLLKMIWSDSLSSLLSVGKLFAVLFAAVMSMTVIIVGYTSVKNKTNPIALVRKCAPVFLIGLTTASSAAAFGTNIKTCREELGIDETITSFGIPLGMVTFKPGTALNYITVSLFFAEVYKVDVSVSWIIILIIASSILALATPPIPGGAMTAYTVLFSQLGIPAQALAVALACDTVFDFIDTGCDQFLIPLSLLNQSRKLGMVDYGVLKKQK